MDILGETNCTLHFYRIIALPYKTCIIAMLNIASPHTLNWVLLILWCMYVNLLTEPEFLQLFTHINITNILSLL